MDRYSYVQSDERNTYFVDNTTARLRVQLNILLYLPGEWEVVLVEFHAREITQSTMKAGGCLYLLRYMQRKHRL